MHRAQITRGTWHEGSRFDACPVAVVNNSGKASQHETLGSNFSYPMPLLPMVTMHASVKQISTVDVSPNGWGPGEMTAHT